MNSKLTTPSKTQGSEYIKLPSEVTLCRFTESILNRQEQDIDATIRQKYSQQQRKLIIIDRSRGKIIDTRTSDPNHLCKQSLYLPQNCRPVQQKFDDEEDIIDNVNSSNNINSQVEFRSRSTPLKSVWEQDWKQLDKIHQQFLQAILKNQSYAFFAFLEKKNHHMAIDVNYRYQSNWSPLHYAAMHSSIQIISRLINHPRIDINTLTDFGQTPLHIAVKANHLQNCELLVSAGVCLDQRDHDHYTALHYASELGYREIVDLLLKAGASSEVKNNNGMIAAELASREFLDLFKKHSSKQQIEEEKEEDPLYRFRSNHKTLVQKMLQLRPEPQSQHQFKSAQKKKQKNYITTTRQKNIFKLYQFIRQTHKIETITLSSFKFYKKIGEGAFGQVYLVRKGTNQRLYALKAIRKERVYGTNLYRYIQTEKDILSLLSHPFIVKLRFAFQTETYLFLVMDFCEGGDLSKLLEKRKRFDQSSTRHYASQILLGLQALHKNNILYRDLKPQNIVLDKDGHALITDFGLSKRTNNIDDLNRSFCGTPAYLPLEIINKQGHTRMADWYEFGVVVYQLYTGFPPFYADTKAELYDLVRQGVIRFPKNTPDIFRDLIKKLLCQNPAKRLGFENDAESIKDHPWFKDIDWQAVLERKLVMPAIQNRIKLGEPIKTKFHDIKSERFQIPMWSFVE